MIMRKHAALLVLLAAIGILSASCTTGGLQRAAPGPENAYVHDGSEELLREIEQFRESLRGSRAEGETHPRPESDDERGTADFLELKGAGPGTGIKAENVPPILEAQPVVAAKAPPRVVEEPPAPAPSVYLVERRPPTVSEIAAEMEDRASGNPSFKRVLAALLLAVGDAEGAFLAANSGRGEEENWETLVRAAASFRIGETDAAISLADQVLRRWKEQAPLKVTKLTLCNRISSYGVYEEYDRGWVVPRQEVLLYCEVDNFVAEKEGEGAYLSTLHIQIEIRDGSKAVWSWDPPEVVDRSRNLRDDLYVGTRFYVPSDLRPGEYKLRVTVSDKVGNKSAKEEIDLVVKSP